MKRLSIILTTALMVAITFSCTTSQNDQPDWPRRYATTVIRGHVNGMPDNITYVTSIWGGASNVKQELIPYDIIDSAGIFSMKWDMCWPMKFEFHICNRYIPLLLCPGDTVDIVMDYPTNQEVKYDIRLAFTEAVHINGCFLPLSPDFRALNSNLLMQASLIDKEYLDEHRDQTFVDYREWQWGKHLARLDTLEASSLQPDEKALLHLDLEKQYLERVDNYDFYKRIIGFDADEVKAFAAQKTLVDSYADSLSFPYDLNSVYFFDVEVLPYLEANGLADTPFGCYLQERRQVENIVEQLKACHSVSSETIDSLPAEYHQPLYELKAIADAELERASWLPTGDPSTWLQQIVERHPGHVVFVDFWATWCNPCRMGINAMSTVKEDYEERGVDFVYITDNSSTTEGFQELKQQHAGDHFLFMKSDIKKMDVPGYHNAIPHYLIYGRDGRLIKFISGWEDLETMTAELDSALSN